MNMYWMLLFLEFVLHLEMELNFGGMILYKYLNAILLFSFRLIQLLPVDMEKLQPVTLLLMVLKLATCKLSNRQPSTNYKH